MRRNITVSDIPAIFVARRQFESLWECPECHIVIRYPSLPRGYSPSMQTME